MKKQTPASPSIGDSRAARTTGESPKVGNFNGYSNHSSPSNEKRASNWSPSANRVYSSPYSQKLTTSNPRSLTYSLSSRSNRSAEKKSTSDKKKREKSPSLNSALDIPTTPTADSSIDNNDLVERICPSGPEPFGINTKISNEINQQPSNSKNKENTPKSAMRKMKEHQRAQDGMILMLKGEINRKKQLLTSTQDKTNAVNNELKLCENKIIDLNNEIEILKDQLKQSNGEIALLKFQIKKSSHTESPESIEVLQNQLDVSVELNKRLEAQMKTWLDEQVKLHRLIAEKEVEHRGQPLADKIECKVAAQPVVDSTAESPHVFVQSTAVKPNAPSSVESSPRVFRDLFSGLCSTFDEAPAKAEEVFVSESSIAVATVESTVVSASDTIEVESVSTSYAGGMPRSSAAVSDAFVYDSAKRKPLNTVAEKENAYNRPSSSSTTTSATYNYSSSRSTAIKSVMTPNSSFIEQLNRVKEENNSIKNDIMKFRGRLKVLQLDI